MSAEPRTESGDAGLEAPIRLDDESIEAIAQRVAELIVGEGERADPRRGITADEVARTWGVSRRWVYEKASELGASPIGRGARPRLRFDPSEVAAVLGAPKTAADARGCAGISGDRGTDSLSTPARASVARQSRRAAGRPADRRRTGAARAADIADGGPRRSA